MSQRRWLALLGVPLGFALVTTVVIGLVQPPTRAGGSASLARLVSCGPGQGTAPRTAAPMPGASWKTIDVVDGTGALVARQLFVGEHATPRASAKLAVESAVSGPVDGLVVVTEDDGARSSVLLVDVAARCWQTIDRRAEVIRSAIVDPHDGSVFAHVVARAGRADLGTVRIAPAGGGWTSTLVAAPLSGELAAQVGQVFGTGLAVDRPGSHVAVQSCTDLACVTRIFDLAHPAAAPTVVRGPDQGPMLGFAGTDLVTWAACVGTPCGLLAWDIMTSHARQLAPGAVAASLTRDGRRLVAELASEAGTELAEIDVATARSSRLRGLPAGAEPLGSGPATSAGLEVADDEVAVAIPGGDPIALRPDSAAVEALP
jgi:hypothetical protein